MSILLKIPENLGRMLGVRNSIAAISVLIKAQPSRSAPSSACASHTASLDRTVHLQCTVVANHSSPASLIN
jgi:hypothetical protein